VDYFEEDRIRSPLIMCEWYRVIMDEVQMVGDGKVESVIRHHVTSSYPSDECFRQMVSMIPRLSSLAVSGTPARAKVGDLSHVVRFLRVQGAADSTGWKKLCLPENVDLFAVLFRSYSIRSALAVLRRPEQGWLTMMDTERSSPLFVTNLRSLPRHGTLFLSLWDA
jgi:E3 ubiquitin-protein ligase SHPRH